MADILGNLILWLPMPVLIALAVAIAIGLLLGFVSNIANRAAERRKEEERRLAEHERRREEERERLVRERAASIKRHREDAARKEKQEVKHREEAARLDDKRRVDALGKQGAGVLKRAKSHVERILSTEAAREGWLGEIDFTPDIEEIEDRLLRAHSVRRKSDDLSALPKPNDDDRKMIAEAKATVAQLERKTKERVGLLERCALEASLIDESLRTERDNARVAAKREELHGELAAMLFGVEAADATTAESAADAVLARVQAYREIKGQIERARNDTDIPPEGEGGTVDESSAPWIVAPILQAWRWIVD